MFLVHDFSVLIVPAMRSSRKAREALTSTASPGRESSRSPPAPPLHVRKIPAPRQAAGAGRRAISGAILPTAKNCSSPSSAARRPTSAWAARNAAQFRHVAQHRHPAAGRAGRAAFPTRPAWNPRWRCRRRRAPARRRPRTIAGAFWRAHTARPRSISRAVQAQFRTDRQRKQGVGHLMAAQQVDAILAVEIGLAAVHAETSRRCRPAGFLAPASRCPRPARRARRRPGSGAPWLRPFVVAVDEKPPSGGRASASLPSSRATPARSPKNSRCSRPMLVMHAELRGRSFGAAAPVRRDGWCRPRARRPGAMLSRRNRSAARRCHC